MTLRKCSARATPWHLAAELAVMETFEPHGTPRERVRGSGREGQTARLGHTTMLSMGVLVFCSLAGGARAVTAPRMTWSPARTWSAYGDDPATQLRASWAIAGAPGEQVCVCPTQNSLVRPMRAARPAALCSPLPRPRDA